MPSPFTHPNRFREWWWFVPFRRDYIPPDQLWGIPHLKSFLEQVLVMDGLWQNIDEKDSDFEPIKRKWWYRYCEDREGNELTALAFPAPKNTPEELYNVISRIVARHGFWFNFFPPIEVKKQDSIFFPSPV